MSVCDDNFSIKEEHYDFTQTDDSAEWGGVKEFAETFYAGATRMVLGVGRGSGADEGVHFTETADAYEGDAPLSLPETDLEALVLLGKSPRLLEMYETYEGAHGAPEDLSYWIGVQHDQAI